MPDTVITNALLPSGSGGDSLEREALRDVLEDLTRDQTPFFSNLRKVTATGIKEEWGTEDIGSISAAAARNRGYVAAPQAPFTPDRLNNYLQLMAVEFGVSHSAQAVDTVGNHMTLDHQRMRWGLKLRRQINKLLYTPQAKVTTEPTKLATLHAYIVTGFVPLATTPGAAPTGDGTDIPGAGTGTVAFDSIDSVDDALEALVASAGVPDLIYMSPKRKRDWSHLPDASIAENRINMTAGNVRPFQFVGAAENYLSDFGELEVAVDIDAPNAGILGVNHDYLDMPVLPGMDFNEYRIGKRGSADEMGIEFEATLRVLNPK
ncbi:MAG: hypothetical protein K0R61_3223, partial [Microvirga sp.]|nr:hypothetical protein [Microvirga sp.]